MIANFSKYVAVLFAAVMGAVCMGIPVWAGGIPATGDGSGAVLPIMAGLLILSVVLIVVYAILSAKKKKK